MEEKTIAIIAGVIIVVFIIVFAANLSKKGEENANKVYDTWEGTATDRLVS